MPLRLPDGWKTPSQYLVLEGLRLLYGEEAILQVLSASRMVKRTPKTGKLVRKREASAVKLPVRAGPKGVASVCERRGATSFLGDAHLAAAVRIDRNEDHLGLPETDRFGDRVDVRRIGLHLDGKGKEEGKAILFSCRSRADRSQPGLHVCDGCGQPRGLVPSAGEDWVSGNAYPCQRQSCLLATGVMSLGPTRKRLDATCMVVSMAVGPEETQSGSWSTRPFGKQSTGSDAFAPEDVGLGRYPGFTSEIPAREPSAAPFGRHPGGSSVVGEWLSML